jgi:CRISPR/Cas system CSM-associated protein Csm4 (group 5 of RAMP superfamily)
MKSSAIDCELNYAENKDGTFECLSLKGKVGDFLYHPNLQTDILESASQFQIKKKEEKKVRYFTYKTKRYAATDSEGKFNIYDAEDLDTLIGTMESKDGKPIPPIRFL